MRIVFYFVFLFTALSSSAAPLPPLTNEHPPGLTIENAYYVGHGRNLIRGRLPRDEISEFRAAGITNILIVKNQTSTEVDVEKNALKAMGYTVDGPNPDVVQVPFRWKQIDQDLACKQTVQILKHIREIEETPNKTLYFHCTAGIDRTGLIAGLYRLTVEPRSTLRGIFRNELCGRGYGDAEPRPPTVGQAIHAELTPIYLKFARAIVQNRHDHFLKGDLENICNPDYYNSLEVENFVKEELPRTKCHP